MSKQRWEYKVAFVDFRGRVSIEGEETMIEEGERMTAFGRRFLNALGEQGWELVDIQMQAGGNAFHIFKRALAEGEQAEPAIPIDKSQPRQEPFTMPFPGPHAGHPGAPWHMPPPPPGFPPPPRPGEDVLIRFVRRGPDDPAPQEFTPPQP
jgi:hypothetical protein